MFAFFVSATKPALTQNLKELVSFSGKKYLGETGVYLNFLNDRQAIFYVDTFQYKVKQDTIYFERISWLIGETRQSFTQRYIYLFRKVMNELKLFDLKTTGNEDRDNKVILLKEISKQKEKLSGLKAFTITKSEYITWSSETDTSGKVVRKETIYVITSLTITQNKKLVTDIRQRTVFWTTNKTTHQDKIISIKSRTLPPVEYNQYIKELEAQYYVFFKGDDLCGEQSLSYTFLYKTSRGIHTYKRCWLNELELPVANWIPGR